MSPSTRRPRRPADRAHAPRPPLSVVTRSGLRIHGIQTGYVGVKLAHAELRGPARLRLLSIILGRRWAPLLPILCWLIEGPDGLTLIDTGELAAARDIDSYMAADPANRWFFSRNLPLFVEPAEELGAQLAGLGLDPAAVRTVVLTHLHQDHVGGLGRFPNARFVLARAEHAGQLRQPMGAVRSLWPAGFAPELIDHAGPALGGFAASHALSAGGDLLIVPTPGHSYGHQSVLLRDGDADYLFAGDLAFSAAQLRAGGLQGIAQDLGQARRSLAQARAHLALRPTVLLPSHDPDALRRLGQRETTAP